MSPAKSLQAQSLAALPGIRHGFFTREGGVSQDVYATLNGGIGSNDAPDRVAENRAPHGAGAWRFAGPFPHRLSDPFARRRHRRTAMGAGCAATRRRHGDTHARYRARRLDRRLRPGAVRRPAGAGDRRSARRLARRLHRRAGGDHRRDGKARRGTRAPHGRARPDDPAKKLRSRPRIRRARSAPPTTATANSSCRQQRQATRCSIWPATRGRDCSALASRRSKTSISAPLPIRKNSTAIAAPRSNAEADYGRHINAIALTE